MRKAKRVRIKGPLTKGQKVLRQAPKGPAPWHNDFRWYNPDGGDFEMEVDLDDWIQLRARDGDIQILSPKVKAGGKDKGVK